MITAYGKLRLLEVCFRERCCFPTPEFSLYGKSLQIVTSYLPPPFYIFYPKKDRMATCLDNLNLQEESGYAWLGFTYLLKQANYRVSLFKTYLVLTSFANLNRLY